MPTRRATSCGRAALTGLMLMMPTAGWCLADSGVRGADRVGVGRSLGAPLEVMRVDPDAAVRRFAQEELAGGWFTPGRDDFVAGAWVRSGAQRVARVTQWCQGHPVLGGEVRVVLDPEDRVCLVNGRFLPGLDPPELAIVSQAQAQTLALTALGLQTGSWKVVSELAVTRLDTGDHLVWAVRIEEARGGRAWQALVDSQNGAVLQLDDLACHAPGLVYPTDPRQPLEERQLFGLTDDSTRLVHRFFSVENRSLDPLSVPDHDFRFPQGHALASRLPEVNAYWHAQRFIDDFLGPLGYAGPPEPLVLRIGESLAPYAALTSGRFVLLGSPVGTSTRDAALSDDIITHELQHAVTYGYGIGASGIGREALSLHEGISDFMAACSTEDPSIGEWLFTAFPGGVTRVDRPASTFRYSNYDHVAFGGVSAGSGWANGMILSGALWDLRAVLGPVTEQLVLRSLAYLPSAPQWSQLVNAMLEVDFELFDGAHVPAILAAFTNREIRGLLTVSIIGNSYASPGVAAWFTAVVEGVSADPVEWSIRRFCGNEPCGDWVPLASGPTIRLTESTDFELRCAVAGLVGNAESTRFIDVLKPSVIVVGPQVVDSGETHTYTTEVQGVGPMTYDWWRTFNRPPFLRERVGSGPSVLLRADAGFTLECRITDVLGRRAETWHYVSFPIILPTVEVLGPRAMSPGETATFIASPRGVAPFEITWFLLDSQGRLQTRVGEGPSLTIRQPTDFVVRVMVYDKFGRLATATRSVAVLDAVGMDGPSPPFALETADISKGNLQVRFQLPQAAPARILVLDVSGREVARLWDGVQEAGEAKVHWEASGSRDGIYFVRLEALGRAISRRVALIRQ